MESERHPYLLTMRAILIVVLLLSVGVSPEVLPQSFFTSLTSCQDFNQSVIRYALLRA